MLAIASHVDIRMQSYVSILLNLKHGSVTNCMQHYHFLVRVVQLYYEAKVIGIRLCQ